MVCQSKEAKGRGWGKPQEAAVLTWKFGSAEKRDCLPSPCLPLLLFRGGGGMLRILTEPSEEMLQPRRFPHPASRTPRETLPGALATRHSLSPDWHAKALESASCRSGASDLETTESSSPKLGPHFSQIWKSPRGHVGFPLQQV